MAVYAYESVTVAGTAGSLTAATADNAVKATVTVETAQVRYRGDGTAPTAAVGHILNAGDVLTLESNDEIKRAQFIRTTGTSATLRVTYEI